MNLYQTLISILLIIILTGLLIHRFYKPNKEGLDNLIDWRNIPVSEASSIIANQCGDGIFSHNINKDIGIESSQEFTHSNMKACEAECKPGRECMGVSFDVASKDVMKKCTTYKAAPLNKKDAIKANTICSRVPASCSANNYQLNKEFRGNGAIIQPRTGGNFFRHTNEGACAAECTSREDCTGYLYNNQPKSSGGWQPCWLFRNTQPNQPGFPLQNICTKEEHGLTGPSHKVANMKYSCSPNYKDLKGNPVTDGILGCNSPVTGKGVGFNNDLACPAGSYIYCYSKPKNENPVCDMHENSVWAFCGNNPVKRWGIGPEGKDAALGNCNYAANKQGSSMYGLCPPGTQKHTSTPAPNQSSGKCSVDNNSIIAAFGATPVSVNVSNIYNPICASKTTKETCVPVTPSCPKCCQWTPTS